MDEVAKKRRFGASLIVVGWVHLAAFLSCQAIVSSAVKSDPRHLALWVGDLAACLAAIRFISGAGWHRASRAATLIARIWATFLILAFNLATLNGLAGWSHDWFKPPWATLSSFGFAVMAWLFDSRFLVPAVQMYLTGLLMITFPAWNYAIFGVSWWLVLESLGGWLAYRAWKEARA
jgi:hypothetical protein